MKPLCPKCLTTHWEDQACKVKSLAELPAIFPSPPSEKPFLVEDIKKAREIVRAIFPSPPVEPSQIDDSFHNPELKPMTLTPEKWTNENNEKFASALVKVLESTNLPTLPFADLVKPKKVLSKAHLAALKAGREAKAKHDKAR